MNHSPQERLNQVRAKIIEAVPEILKLDFGCVIENICFYKDEKKTKLDPLTHQNRRGTVVKDLRHEWLPMWVDYGDQLEFQIAPDDYVSFDVIGRPITLADVLRAIDDTKARWILSPFGFKVWFSDENGVREELMPVDFSLTLDQYPPELISFLHKILCQ